MVKLGSNASNDTDKMANSIDPDLTAPFLGLYCLFRPICSGMSQYVHCFVVLLYVNVIALFGVQF